MRHFVVIQFRENVWGELFEWLYTRWSMHFPSIRFGPDGNYAIELIPDMPPNAWVEHWQSHLSIEEMQQIDPEYCQFVDPISEWVVNGHYGSEEQGQPLLPDRLVLRCVVSEKAVEIKIRVQDVSGMPLPSLTHLGLSAAHAPTLTEWHQTLLQHSATITRQLSEIGIKIASDLLTSYDCTVVDAHGHFRELLIQEQGPESPSVAPELDETELTLRRSDKPIDNYVFRRDGNTWEIAYQQGKTFHLKELLGLNYIHQLLSLPRKELNPIAMERAAGASGTATVPGYDEQGDLAPYDPGFTEPAMDAQALKECEERVQVLIEEIRIADGTEDEARRAKAERELDEIERVVKSAKGLGGRPRKMPSELHRSINKIQKAIATAIKQIGSYDKPLADHLIDSIKPYRGYRAYQPPEEPPNWKLK